MRVRLLQLAGIQDQVAALPTAVHFKGDWITRLGRLQGYHDLASWLKGWRERDMEWMKQDFVVANTIAYCNRNVETRVKSKARNFAYRIWRLQ